MNTVTRLLIARHGNTFNKGDVVTRVGGRTDLPLVQSGLEQATQLGQLLAHKHWLPQTVFASGLQRAQQTAQGALQQLALDLPVHVLEQFNEIDYGPDENKPEDEVVARLGTDTLQLWDEQGIVPQGWLVDVPKIINGWQSFAADCATQRAGQTTLVVSSNGIIRFAPHITGDFEAFRQAYDIKVATGALCSFVFDGTTWQCEAWNMRPKDVLPQAA